MSGGQDPATWDYEVTTARNPSDEELIAIVRRYLIAVESHQVAEVYELRKKLKEKVAGSQINSGR